MEQLKKKIDYFEKAEKTLQESIASFGQIRSDNPIYSQIRDSLIKRFEYTLETFWKLIRAFLQQEHGLKVPGSPRGVIRTALDAGIITKDQFTRLIDMIDDRNLTSHTYNIDLAEEISAIIPSYYVVMHAVVAKIKDQVLT